LNAIIANNRRYQAKFPGGGCLYRVRAKIDPSTCKFTIAMIPPFWASFVIWCFDLYGPKAPPQDQHIVYNMEISGGTLFPDGWEFSGQFWGNGTRFIG